MNIKFYHKGKVKKGRNKCKGKKRGKNGLVLTYSSKQRLCILNQQFVFVVSAYA